MRSSTLASATDFRPPRVPALPRRGRRDLLALVAAAYLVAVVLMTLAAPLLTPYAYDEQRLEEGLRRPGANHLLGTDQFGRDVFTRIAYGARVSLTAGMVAVSAEAVLGALWGATAGLLGGPADAWMMRVADLFIAFPPLLLALLITGLFGPGLVNVVIALVLTAWPGMARLVRSHVVVLREREFVEAARAAGAGTWWIIRRHLLPNVAHLVAARGTLDAGMLILLEATLSFVGVGVQPPRPSWGLMIQEAFGYLRSATYLLVAPAVFLSLTVVSLNVVGEYLVDVLDPRGSRLARGPRG